jgi:hypothetical protein
MLGLVQVMERLQNLILLTSKHMYRKDVKKYYIICDFYVVDCRSNDLFIACDRYIVRHRQLQRKKVAIHL